MIRWKRDLVPTWKLVLCVCDFYHVYVVDEALDAACKTALAHGAYRLRTLRQLLKRGAGDEQQQFDFIEHHPVIRPLSDYSLESLRNFRKERHHERNPS